MAEVVVMPQLGNTVESCLVTQWLVKVGDTIDEGTLICAIETDKSSMEVPAGVAGTVLALLVEEGDDVPVKDPIIVVGEAGEAVDPSLLNPPTGEETPAAAEFEATGTVAAGPVASAANLADNQSAGTSKTESSPAAVSGQTAPVSPRARGLAASQGIGAASLTGSGPGGRVITRDVEAAIAGGASLTVGARGEAENYIPGTPGTGIGGRVTRAELQAIDASGAISGATADISADTSTDVSTTTSATTMPADFPGSYTDTPLKGVRKVIAERMMSSLQNSAQLTLTATAPADGLLALRKRLKNAPEELGLNRVTIGDLIGYATAKTLARFPAINAHLENQRIRSFDSVHLGVAVDTPRGLLVPTVRFAETLTLREFSDLSKVVANQAIDGSISPDLLGGGTFTVSNLGAFGIESFTPVLNEPQVGILGVGTITPRPVELADGTIGIEQRVWLSLTMDHRAFDGADGARFLKDLVSAIANIDLTVLG